MEIRFLGHAAFALSDGDTTVLIDPFLTGNPKAAASADEVDATTILLTHGHADHIGDTVPIAKRTGATVIGLASPANHAWLSGHGVIPVEYGEGVADRPADWRARWNGKTG